jgi:copper(I)-binding protein
MHQTLRRFISALATVAALAGHAQAHEYYAEGFTFVHPWAEATANDATDAPVYFKLDNIIRNDRLLSATTRMAERVELRGSNDDTAPALEAIEIAPAEQLVFYAGRPHLLLRGLVAPLQWGRSYDLRVVFEKAGAIDVQISIGAH